MLGFYSARKLAEAGKLSPATIGRQVPLAVYPWKGKEVTRINWHRLSELYDLEHRDDITRDLFFVCHQMVHSYVFAASFTESGLLQGVLFCSDRYRHKHLFYMSLPDVIELFQLVGNDYPDRMTLAKDEKIKDYKTS